MAELPLIILLFALAPPLIAFALYFALLHTPRALAAQWTRSEGGLALTRTAALTVLACALGAGIFVAAPGLSLEVDTARTAFMLLAALTVPHMVLEHANRVSRLPASS